MSNYDSYMKRLKRSGATQQNSVIEYSKRKAESYIMHSPSRSEVDVCELRVSGGSLEKFTRMKGVTAIVSNKESFYKREILTPHNKPTILGDYVEHQGMTYLVNEVNLDEIYPNSFMLLCNYELDVIKTDRVYKGLDPFGKPKWDYEESKYSVPCSIESKEYSIAENAAIPLPDGVINIFIPYHEVLVEDVPVNYLAEFDGETYQVTSINHEKVFDRENGERFGYLVLRGQMVVDSNAV